MSLYAPQSAHDMKTTLEVEGEDLCPVEVMPIINANCRCKKVRMTGHAISKSNTVRNKI